MQPQGLPVAQLGLADPGDDLTAQGGRLVGGHHGPGDLRRQVRVLAARGNDRGLGGSGLEQGPGPGRVRPTRVEEDPAGVDDGGDQGVRAGAGPAVGELVGRAAGCPGRTGLGRTVGCSRCDRCVDRAVFDGIGAGRNHHVQIRRRADDMGSHFAVQLVRGVDDGLHFRLRLDHLHLGIFSGQPGLPQLDHIRSPANFLAHDLDALGDAGAVAAIGHIWL